VCVLCNAQPVGRDVCSCTWYYFDLLTCFSTLLCFRNACLAMACVVGAGPYGGRRRWRRGRYVPALLALCACMVFLAHKCITCLLVLLCCRAALPGAVHVDEEVSVDGRYGRVPLPYPDEWPLCCSPHHRFTRAFLLRCRIAPPGSGAWRRCRYVLFFAIPSPFAVSVCMVVRSPPHLLSRGSPAAGTRAGRYSRRRHGLHGGLDGGGGGAGTCRAVQYPAPSGSMCV